MATTNEYTPTFHRESPSPEVTPSLALGACPELSRCLSTASSVSHGSATTDVSNLRDSLGSDQSGFSRQSSASYQSARPSDASTVSSLRRSTGSFDAQGKPSGAGRRRGYMRPTGTDFAASAKQRESVLSLGSIAHLQYYFARTGLLDGKGAQLQRKRQLKAQTLDLSSLEASSFLTPQVAGSDIDSSYASMGSSPDLAAHAFPGPALGPLAIVESPTEEHRPGEGDDAYYFDDYEEPDASMPPPTTSTYNFRDKPLPKPPSIRELKAELTAALDDAAKALADGPPPHTDSPSPVGDGTAPAVAPGWFEIQGVHILDVMTLAIRAAKVYYTSHEQPDRLDAIKSEKELRSDLLAVMDVLRRMAARNFAGGLRTEEQTAMNGWIDSVHSILKQEEEVEAAETTERASWTWLSNQGWEGRDVEREYAFLQSLLRGSGQGGPKFDAVPDEALPPWTPIDRTAVLASQNLPTPFLKHMQNGLRLVQLHNAAVRKSKRRFGAIPTYHTDTQKPYRCADNLRYWAKAAELRWEVLLKMDTLGIVYNSSPQVWVDFEDAILKWCKRVREEIAAELQA